MNHGGGGAALGRQRAMAVAKIAVSALTLTYVLWAVPISQLWLIIKQAKPAFLLLALVLFLGTQLVSALRFAAIAKVLGRELSAWRATEVHFVGLWMNQVLPTGLGGDVVKILMLKDELGFGVALRAGIIDRLSGLLILLVHAALFMPAYYLMYPTAPALWILGAASAACLLAVVVACASERTRDRLRGTRVLRPVASFGDDLAQVLRGRSLGKQFVMSVIIHLNGIAAYLLIGRAIGVDAGAVQFVLLTPILFLISLVPVTFAGWGLREFGAIGLFGLAGVPAQQAVAMSVLFGILMIVAGLPGLALILYGSAKSEVASARDGG